MPSCRRSAVCSSAARRAPASPPRFGPSLACSPSTRWSRAVTTAATLPTSTTCARTAGCAWLSTESCRCTPGACESLSFPSTPPKIGSSAPSISSRPCALAEAIGAVAGVKVTPGQTRLVSSICVEADVLGHRADVVIDRAMRALAAYRRHHTPTREDIYDAATLALAHRARQPLRREDDE